MPEGPMAHSSGLPPGGSHLKRLLPRIAASVLLRAILLVVHLTPEHLADRITGGGPAPPV